jgi:hypothetical protein
MNRKTSIRSAIAIAVVASLSLIGIQPAQAAKIQLKIFLQKLRSGFPILDIFD